MLLITKPFPLSNKGQFEEHFQSILKTERPVIVLQGKDEDVIFLSEFKEKYPEYADIIPVGASLITKILFNMHERYLFPKRHEIPFTESIFYRSGSDYTEIVAFAEKTGFLLHSQYFPDRDVQKLVREIALAIYSEGAWGMLIFR